MSKKSLDISRRTLLRSSLLGTVGAALPAFSVPAVAKPGDTSGSVAAVVETAGGKVRGVLNNEVHAYRGIRYGASTAGSNRFMPPRRPESWTGVRDAFQNGHSAPQLAPAPSAIGSGLRSNAPQSEDCLVLNVFTRGPNDNRQRPVMMWIHGGGYAYGAGSSLGYDGANLARTGDVVVVCINHRLNVLGHLYLGNAHPDLVDSGNVALLDVVAALQWVRDNIARFGGDPGNVTIFGQSGGGGKVSALVAMPAAKGLFHKAIIQSGSTLTQVPRDEAQKTTARIAAELRVAPNDFQALQKVPLDKLLGAMAAAGRSGALRLAPVVDGHSLPRHPWDPTAPDVSADVPMIIGTTETEGTYFAPPELLSMDEATARARLKERIGGDSDRVFDLFRRSRPRATVSELYFTISAFPSNAHIQAERKAEQRRAPAFMYQIRWRTPAQDGRRLAPHCVEIPFSMQNHWIVPELVGTGPDLQTMADQVSGAWVAFARHGNPSHPGIPKWSAYNASERPVMLMNNQWEVVRDPDREERLAMDPLPRLPMF